MGLNNFVDFTTAKLLKEKGFDTPCREGWVNYLSSFIGETKMPDNESNLVLDMLGNRHLIERPPISDVVMWLYEEHELWIVVNIDIQGRWYFELFNLKDKRNAEILVDNEYWFGSPNEAYEAGIIYTLKNLIK